MALLKVALLQMVSFGRDVDANLRKGEAVCRTAARAGADLALFPEMWSIGCSGFDPKDPADQDAWRSRAVARDERFVQHFRHLAAELRMAIGITYLERWPNAPRNTFTLFDRQGDEVLTYAKVHLGPWDPPDNACTSGEDFPVATLSTPMGAVHVGCMICFDREFPEAARVLMLNGAELILTPNACELAIQKPDDGFGDARIAQFRARAFENLAAVAMANFAAPQNDGHSVAFNGDGSLIVQAGTDEELVLAPIDLDKLRDLRHREAGRDAMRWPEKYAAISSLYHRRPLASLDQTQLQAAASRYRVREAGVADAPKIAEAHVESIRTLGALHYDEDVIEAWSAGGNIHESRYIGAMEGGEVFFIALDPAGHVLGFSTHNPTINGQHRTAIYVRGGAARQGVGTALFRTAEAHALGAGAKEIHVDAALSAVEFYKANGFEELSRGEHRLGSGQRMACVFMRKTLTR